MKPAATFAILFLAIGTAKLQERDCDDAQICSFCQCSGLEISCDQFESDSHTLLEEALLCGFKNISIKANGVVLPWASIVGQGNKSFDNLDLAGSQLNCSCENAWIDAWSTIEHTNEHCHTHHCPIVPLGHMAKFPRMVTFPPNKLEHCSEEPKDFLATCDAKIPPLSVTSTSARVVCKTRRESDCLESEFVSAFQVFRRESVYSAVLSNERSKQVQPTSTRHGCETSSVLNLEGGDVSDSGWLVCRIKSGLLPGAQLIPVFRPGPPSFVYWNCSPCIEREHRYRAVIASFGTEVKIRLWYYPGNETIYQIRPHPDVKERNELFNWKSSTPNMQIVGWTIKQEVLIFHDPVSQCRINGQYRLEACDSENICTGKTFEINRTPWLCREVNEKFQIVNTTFLQVGNVTTVNDIDLEIWGMDKPGRDDEDQQTKTATPADPLAAMQFRLALLVCIIVSTALMVICVVFVCVLCRQKMGQGRRVPEAMPLTDMNVHRSQSMSVLENHTYINWYTELKQKKEIPLIPTEDFTTLRELGEGAFGKVFLVAYRPNIPYRQRSATQPNMELATPTTVNTSINTSVDETAVSRPVDYREPPRAGQLLAIKQLKYVTLEKLANLEREAVVLVKLRHPNIVHFYGVTAQNDGFALVFEYMPGGDLVNYLRSRNPDYVDSVDIEEFLEISALLKIAIQVAIALEYLADRHLVHRDLAARNCLVGEGLQVKLSDFGMTRDVYVNDYYKMDSQTLVPLRWLPPESIIFRKFTTESDIWSFGILLWEIFSYGQVPWYIYSNSEVLEIVKAGRLLTRPETCPSQIYNALILRCWAQRPSDRITASEAREILQNMYEDAALYCELTEND